MDKPFSVKKVEFKEDVVDLVNNSQLPACLVEEIMTNILIEIKEQARLQYEKDLQAWEETEDVHSDGSSDEQ